ncbi:MAG: metallophosphatase family protein [Anaerolineae bacterium]|nr:metallophosphatase family protein [Anaerolineae bacterium]
MRIAVLSDIHGNLLALESVLSDLEARGLPDLFWVLGDLAAFGPWPAETIARLRALPHASFLQGNTDRYLVTGRRPAMPPVRSPEEWSTMPARLAERDANFRWTVERLPFSAYEFLRDLPTRLELDVPGYGRIVAVHATALKGPGEQVDDETFVYPDAPAEMVRSFFSTLDARLVLYGHTHRPVERLVNGMRIVNDGSVGLPMDGDPRPAYLLLDIAGGECTVTLCRVAYEREKVVAELERVNHPAKEWVSGILRRASS